MTPGQHTPTRSAGIRSKNPPRSWFVTVNGHRLRQLRRDHGLTQAELAVKAGIGLTTLARLERLPRTSCRSRTFVRLATALGEDPRSSTLGPIG